MKGYCRPNRALPAFLAFLMLLGGLSPFPGFNGPAAAEPTPGAGGWSDSFDEPAAAGGISEALNVTVDNGSAAPGWDLDLGTGADGNLTVCGTFAVDSVKAALVETAQAGNATLNLSAASGFYSGDEVLVIQMTGADAGTREFARVTGIGGNILAIEKGLSHSYNVSANHSIQCIRVPQFTGVTVLPGGTMSCAAWGGTTGGVLCFRATGNVTVQRGGGINAAGKGFNGGFGSQGGTGGAAGSGGSGGAAAGGGNNGSAGGNGTSLPGGGIGGNGGNGSYYKGGKGGDGAMGSAGNNGTAGANGTGPGGGTGGMGGDNCATAEMEVLQPGCGGGGGRGGKGGQGGGGGGGGGGGASAGRSGWMGSSGGSGATGGSGGRGGGIVIVAAARIVIDGLVTANGSAGGNGSVAGNGGRGGSGGSGGGNGTVAGNSTDGGGGGGGGTGGGGGNGGCGAGGGAGGCIWLAARGISMADASVFAAGGAGGSGGRGGTGGTGGSGGASGGGNATAGGAGAAGVNGTNGTSGTAGAPGKIRLDSAEISGDTVPPAGWRERPRRLAPAWIVSTPVIIDTGLLWKGFDACFTAESGASIDFEIVDPDGNIAKACRGQDLLPGGLDIAGIPARSLRLRALFSSNGSFGASLEGWNVSWYTFVNRDPLAPEGLAADGHPAWSPGVLNLTDPAPTFAWKFRDPDDWQSQGGFNVSVHTGPGHSGTPMWQYEAASAAQCVTYGSGGGARPLVNGTDYYFSIRVRDDFPPAPGWSFTSELPFHMDATPSVPERVSPDGRSTVSSPVFLAWTESSDAEWSTVGYEYQLFGDNDNSSPAASGAVEASGAAVGLSVPGTYLWRVRALDQYGSSPWSPLWSFDCSGPDRPPAIGAIPAVRMHFNQTVAVDMSLYCSDPEDGTGVSLQARVAGGPPSGLEVSVGNSWLNMVSSSVEGIFTVEVTAADSRGARATGSIKVVVVFMPPLVSGGSPAVLQSSSSLTVDLGNRVSPQAGGGLRFDVQAQSELAYAGVCGTNLTLAAGPLAGNGTVGVAVTDDFGQRTLFELPIQVVPSPGSGPRLSIGGAMIEGGRTFEIDLRGRTSGTGPFSWQASSSNPEILGASVEGHRLVLRAGRPAGDARVAITVMARDANNLTDTASPVFTVGGPVKTAGAIEGALPILAVGVALVMAAVVAVLLARRRKTG